MALEKLMVDGGRKFIGVRGKESEFFLWVGVELGWGWLGFDVFFWVGWWEEK